MEHAELLARARSMEFAAWWRDVERWYQLVEFASQESPARTPVSAAVWEAMWRVDAGLAPQRWAASGPQPSDSSDRLNPFLAPDVTDDSLVVLSEIDPDAADLIRAAAAAERVPLWWQPTRLVADYVKLRRQSDTFIDRFFAQQGPRDVKVGASDPTLPANRVDDYEVALTRLLLIGHPRTTSEILPTALTACATHDDSALIDQFRLTEFALRRVPRDRRGRTGAVVSRRLALSKSPRFKPGQGDAGRQLATAAVVLAATRAALRAEPLADLPVSVT